MYPEKYWPPYTLKHHTNPHLLPWWKSSNKHIT